MTGNRQRLFFGLFCVLINVVGCSHQNTLEQLFGDWGGIHKECEYRMTIHENHTCCLVVKNTVSGDKDTYDGIYTVDDSKRPIPFSIIKIKNMNITLHTIISFEGNDELALAEFSPKWKLRPVVFERDKTIKMKRIDHVDHASVTNNN